MLVCSNAVADVVLKYNINGSSSWVPYYIPNQPEQPGILAEIVPQILMLAQIKNEKHNYPPKRTNQALETGLLDFDLVSPSWFPNEDMGTSFVQSDAIIQIKENVITLEENEQKWANIQVIKDQPIGTVRGYLYHDDSLFTRVDFTSERELIKALHKNRIQAAISGDLPALYWSNKLNQKVVLAAVHSNGVLVMRLRKEHQGLLPQINTAIAQLKADGTIDTIIDKYTKKIVLTQ
ncbi:MULTISPECIES: substrate-binding periplasmic protein [Shewanella]|uniref:Transporter substrate-binding domain-containing protein n=1 Tax=Shewanella holmiensis TaxID=2952222 RepID=A0A9X2WJU8_9GAMM|nr:MULTISPECIES: transporter substrate-binding domain-containing protein [Shewanella]MCT7940511.1 transporter substrate-binding domain-containing protein [Shewanella holmiensis]MDP5145823.1 transporter substrate-binding domain-containing protein [Shewanella sp. ULN5]